MRSFIRILAGTQDPQRNEKSHDDIDERSCAGVLERLFAEAEASDARLDEWTGALPATEHAEFMAGAGDFRRFYGRLKDGLSARSSRRRRLRRQSRTSPRQVLVTWSRFGKEMLWKHWQAGCRHQSTSCSSTGQNLCIRVCFRCSKRGCTAVLWWLPTTPTGAPNIWRGFATPPAGFVTVQFAADVEVSMKL
jgi:hypothetical protein